MTKSDLPLHLQNLKIALAHDFLNQLGGAESVLKDLTEIFPDAPIFTLVCDHQATNNLFKNKTIHTTFLQKFPKLIRTKHRKFMLPFCARAAESLDVRGFDLLISSANPWVKGIITPQDTIHISYLHAATRFLWDWRHEYLSEQHLGHIAKYFVQKQTFKMRQWDQLAAKRPDFLLANSHTTQKRIWKYYRREATVLHPGVSTDRYTPKPSSDPAFLILSRLEPFKHVATAIQTFNQNGLPLKIAGTGSQLSELKTLANPNIQFLGRVSESDKIKLFEDCQALIVLTDDDFGITTIESFSAGTPVIALKAGGATELIQPKINGLFFDKLDPISLQKSIDQFQTQTWSPSQISKTAEPFSKENFKKNLLQLLGKII